jgi:DNA excision repair protein ERCC-2
MKFCPNCGTRLGFSSQSSNDVLVCEECDYEEQPISGPTTAMRDRTHPGQKDFGYRPWQPKIIQRVLESIKRGRRVILDAPTGSGKTLIALRVAELLLSEDASSFNGAFAAVRTINEMIPYERDLNRFVPRLSYHYILGKRKACPFYANGDDKNSALCEACLEEKGSPPRMTIDPVQVRRDMARGLYFLETKYVKAISERRHEVVQSGVCLYQSMKEIAGRLSLMTYPYLTDFKISNAQILGTGSVRESLRDSFLIVDEAHNLEDSTDLFTDKLSPKMIENASSAMTDFRFRSEEDYSLFTKRMANLAHHVSKFCNEDGTTAHKEKEAFAKILQDELKEDLLEIQNASAQIEEERRDLARKGSTKRIANPLFPIVDFISNFEELYQKIEIFAENRGISIKVLDPAENLEILQEAKGVLLMSGTMPPKERIEKVWGLDNLEEIRVLRDYGTEYYSVFPKENRETRLVSSVTSRLQARGAETWSSYASIIEKIHEKNEKITLVCCPSYSVAESIYAKLSDESKERSYLETSATRLEDVMQKISDAALSGSKMIVIGVARGKILEGVEFVRDGSSLVGAVVVAGIPYPIPDDILKWRAKVVLQRLGIRAGGKLEFEYFMYQPASIAVRQAIGRAIRFPQDRATIYLADYRFNDKFWKNELGAKK